MLATALRQQKIHCLVEDPEGNILSIVDEKCTASYILQKEEKKFSDWKLFQIIWKKMQWFLIFRI